MDKDDLTPERLKNRSHGSREGNSLCLKRRFDRVVGLSSQPSIPARSDWANQRPTRHEPGRVSTGPGITIQLGLGVAGFAQAGL
jgi:hypothetical protein